MKQSFNLLESTSKIARDVKARTINKDINRQLAQKFGFEYFDGPREQGYGGYEYDGRWVPVAKRIIDRFNLKPGDRVLDIGCAKGFLVHDMMSVMPSLDVIGIDVSTYALDHGYPGTEKRLFHGSCDNLPYPDDYFAAALAINTIHNLDRQGCLESLKEIERVAPGRGFVQVDAYRSPEELDVFIDWMLTANTYLMPDQWIKLFAEAGYTGDYYWTILEVDES